MVNGKDQPMTIKVNQVEETTNYGFFENLMYEVESCR